MATAKPGWSQLLPAYLPCPEPMLPRPATAALSLPTCALPFPSPCLQLVQQPAGSLFRAAVLAQLGTSEHSLQSASPALPVVPTVLAGANVVLDDELAAAISYSIKTPGKALHEKLKGKDEAFGYLRVVLGPELGDGPGVPYVLEIWPGGWGLA